MVTRADEKAKESAGQGWALRGQAVVTPQEMRPAAVLVRGEQVEAVVAPGEVPAGYRIEDVGDRVILPGLVDAHVHINEPGRTEWEGFETATRAAAAGGITTLMDMPLNSSPVTTTPAAFAEKVAAAAGKLWVDVGFYGGIVPGNANQIAPLARAGVHGFKVFLCHSGIDDFPNATEADLHVALPELSRCGLPLLVHAEMVGPLPPEVEARRATEPRSYAAYLASRPPQWEHDAIQLILRLCDQYGCNVHIVHLSSGESLPTIERARQAGLPVSVETCPHYLFFAAEEIPDGESLFKCAPPIRGREDRERLWKGLRTGMIDTIGSDHSPAPPALKHLETGDLVRAWGGISSLQLTLPVVWTAGRQRGISFVELMNFLARHPAALVGLTGQKGSIDSGFDADLVVFDPEAEFTVDAELLHHRHRATPYQGVRLRGRVERTYLRGQKVYDAARFGTAPRGQVLLRSR
jgi:allantoinase